MGSRTHPQGKLQKARNAKFDRILENAPAMFTAAQLRVFLRALVNLDPYTFADDVAEHFAAEARHQRKRQSCQPQEGDTSHAWAGAVTNDPGITNTTEFHLVTTGSVECESLIGRVSSADDDVQAHLLATELLSMVPGLRADQIELGQALCWE